MTETTIGIDISKATLDAHRLSDDVAAQFSNNKAGFRALKNWLKGHDIARIVYEDYATCRLEIRIWRDQASWHSHLM